MSKSSTPISDKRRAANRANALKSTGPRTPEGKATSSQNAVKHGFRSASFAVVRLEELDEVAKLKADAVACYCPVNAQELIAVERIALAQQMIFRAARLEAGLFTDALNEAFDPRDTHPITPMCLEVVGDGDIEIARAQNRNYALAEGFRKLARESKVWQFFLRYQGQAERLYRRALEDFERLKALRTEMPNEPNVGTEPEEKEELPPLSEINSSAARTPDTAQKTVSATPAPVPAGKIPGSTPAQPVPNAIKPAA